jgi:hypothetical protein
MGNAPIGAVVGGALGGPIGLVAGGIIGAAIPNDNHAPPPPPPPPQVIVVDQRKIAKDAAIQRLDGFDRSKTNVAISGQRGKGKELRLLNEVILDFPRKINNRKWFDENR